jgi:hypothetical protein
MNEVESTITDGEADAVDPPKQSDKKFRAETRTR